jgi:lipid A ethanolaminephosphotransferase
MPATMQPAREIFARTPRRPELSAEALILAASVFAALALNGPLWGATLAGRAPLSAHTWLFAAGAFVLLVSVHFVAIALVATRRTVRPLLAVALAAGIAAAYYMVRFGVVIDPAMIRNVLHTDAAEAGELVGPATLAVLALGAVPVGLLWWPRLRERGWRRALAVRSAWVLAALGAGGLAAALVYKDAASLVRNHREVRYMVTPANVAVSLARELAADARAAQSARAPAEPAMRAAAPGRRPTLLVIVVGETVRSANFGLSGYARDTTPELAALPGVIAFPRAAACGTSTEVSVPCMFSPFGRAEYDQTRIRTHDSLLHVLSRAGIRVVWRDNQSGCKGVCDGLEVQDLHRMAVPGLCADGRCVDEILLHDLDRVVAGTSGDLVVAMHQLGNHGPAYHHRYPAAFARFQPACDKADLRSCTREEIVNAYDNAIAYTDHFLAQVIAFLERQRDRFDVAMVYVSDHGESLGEYGLYLHGMPRAVAPREQTEVPMVWWLPQDAAAGLRVDAGCLRGRAAGPASHDNLYHSILGLLEVVAPSYRPGRDLFAGCRDHPAVAAAGLRGRG